MENWIKISDHLPEESGKEPDDFHGEPYYKVLAAIRKLRDGNVETLFSWRGKTRKNDVWTWNLSELVSEPFEVLAWRWPPAADDPAWVSDKMPEDCEPAALHTLSPAERVIHNPPCDLDREMSEAQCIRVLTQTKTMLKPEGEGVIEIRNRLLYPAPFGNGQWEWGLGIISTVHMWMPLPQYFPVEQTPA